MKYKEILFGWTDKLLFKQAARLTHKWFAPAYLMFILVATVLWSFVSFGRDEFRVNRDINTDCYVLAGTEYEILEMGRGLHPHPLKKAFNVKTQVTPLLEFGSSVLVELPDKQRVWTVMDKVHNMSDEQLERPNYQYYHKWFGDVEKDFVGKQIEDIVDDFGEYQIRIHENGVQKFYFPQLHVYKGYKKNDSGMVFEAGTDGIVKMSYPREKDDYNFSPMTVFPFYKTIIDWNIAYRKFADITFLHEKSSSSVLEALLSLVVFVILFVAIGSFPFIILMPYIYHYIYDKERSNYAVKLLVTIPYFIISYIHVLTITDAIDGMNLIIFLILAYTTYVQLMTFYRQVDENRCDHCHGYNVLQLIDCQVVDSRIESETSTTEQEDEPCNNREKYVKVREKYRILHRWYIDVVQKQLVCTLCQSVTVLTEDVVRRQTQEKELMERETETIRSV